MKIALARCETFRIPGPGARPSALLFLRDEEGREAVGEASPIAGWSPETFEESLQAIQAVSRNPDLLNRAAQQLAASAAPSLKSFPEVRAILARCPTASFAIETALLDLLARDQGETMATSLRRFLHPLSRLTVETFASEALPAVETSALLTGAGDGEPFVLRGLSAIESGFRALKVKLRANDDESLRREIKGLLALRRAAGDRGIPPFELRLDPNGRWSVEDARRRLAMLAPAEPVYVEQPVAADALIDLGRCAVPWAADESLTRSEIASRLSREIGCSALVIKPAALGFFDLRGDGGPQGALSLVELARSRDLAVTITHFLDGPVGLAAACETALSLLGQGLSLLACGLHPHPGLTDLPRRLLPHHQRTARAESAQRAGLGLSLEHVTEWLQAAGGRPE